MHNSAIDQWWEKLGLVTTIAAVGVVALAPRIDAERRSPTPLPAKVCVPLQGTAQDRLPRCATLATVAYGATTGSNSR